VLLPPAGLYCSSHLQVSKTINGTPMYTYEIASDKRNYLATIGKKGEEGRFACTLALACMNPMIVHASGSPDVCHAVQDSLNCVLTH
jgi:hypothetical protein